MKINWKEWLFLLPAAALGICAASGLAGNKLQPSVTGAQQTEQTIVAETEPTAAPTEAAEQTDEKAAETAAPKAKKTSYSAGTKWKDGTYTGSGTGFGGTITVQVRIQDGKLKAVRVTNHAGETPSYYAKAKTVISRMLKSQSPSVDTVSGATYSSNGLCEATANALKKAGGTETVKTSARSKTSASKKTTASKTKKTSKTKKKTVSGKPADGTYTGSAVCDVFDYQVHLKVRFRGGKATAIYGFSVTDNDDETNVAYYKKAWKGMVKRILKAQSGNVDAVSGATYSSDAIVQAYQNAYEKAVRAGQKNKKVTATKKPTTTAKPTATATPAASSVPAVTSAPGAAAPKDGTYTASAWVRDVYGDFDDYLLQATVTFRNGLFAGMTDITAKTNKTNLSYCTRAANGTSKKPGVLVQLEEKQNAAAVDAVSGATCSSEALLEIYTQAKKQALETE